MLALSSESCLLLSKELQRRQSSQFHFIFYSEFTDASAAGRACYVWSLQCLTRSYSHLGLIFVPNCPCCSHPITIPGAVITTSAAGAAAWAVMGCSQSLPFCHQGLADLSHIFSYILVPRELCQKEVYSRITHTVSWPRRGALSEIRALPWRGLGTQLALSVTWNWTSARALFHCFCFFANPLSSF